MIERPRFYKQKDVMLINDIPVKKEIEEGEKFSAASNLTLLTSLRTGRTNPFNKVVVPNFEGINSLDIYCTYLDYSYYGEPDIESNFDFKSELRKKKDLREIQVEGDDEVYLVDKDVEKLTHKSIARHTFYKVEHQKDVYISYRLYKELECLLYEIEQVKPKLIIITGKWGLFFLTGKVALAKTLGNYKDKKPLGGLTTYRASIMTLHECFELPDTIVYPMYHTVNTIAMPDKVPIMELDIQKAGSVFKKLKEKGVDYYLVPDKEYIAVADKEIILQYLEDILDEIISTPTNVSMDIETMFSTIIDCIGVTTRTTDGLCIPFASKDNPLLFSLEDEVEIMVKLRELMLHPNCNHVGQNYQYDTTFYYSLWNMDIVAEWDTMVMHHILYNYLPKDLAFLASLYCEHYIYWKGEINATKEDPETRWKYNAKDVCYTLEVRDALEKILATDDTKLQDLYRFQQTRLTPVLNSMMNRGVRIDVARKEELYRFFHTLLEDIVLKIKEVIGEDFNLNSAPQKKKIFADLLQMEIVKRKGKETNDAAAMLEYLENYPLYKPFLSLLLEHSSLKVFTNNFLGMLLDDDNRARTQYKIAGTATGRLASVKNVWGKGGNFMNIPSKGKLDLVQSVELVDENDSLFSTLEVEGAIKLPNVKKIFLPDEGKEICDADYCLTEDHEILTLEGWVNIREFVEERKEIPIACWLSDTGKIYWDMPIDYIEKLYVGDLYSYEGKTSLKGSGNHRQPMISNNGVFRCVRFSNLYTAKGANSKYIHSATTEGSNTISVGLDYLRLLAAMQADGCFVYKNSAAIRFTFKKQGKVDRLLAILKSLEVPYRERYDSKYGHNHIYIAPDTWVSEALLSDLGRDKVFPNWLLQLDSDTIRVFVNELPHWDGKMEKLDNYTYRTTNQENIKAVQALCCLCGKYSAISTDVKEGYKPVYSLYISDKTLSQDVSTVRSKEHFTGVIYCVTSPTNYIVVRRNGKVTITGNSGADIMIVAADSECKWLLDYFDNPRGCGKVYAYIASEFLQREVSPTSREYKVFKAVFHGSNYGLGITKLALMAGIPIEQAKEFQNYYFTLNPEIKDWQNRIVHDISIKGFITNIFGRRGWFLNRNDPTLHNKAFAFKPQSSIADLMNRAMVNMYEKYPEMDILLQVHDSAVTQYDKEYAELYRKRVIECMEIPLPYKKTLTIPADIQVSIKSYGDVKGLVG